MSFWKAIKHFKKEEFDSPDVNGGGEFMEIGVVDRLDQIRCKIGKPIRVTSGYRTEAHNRAVGGSPLSAHVVGRAVDIACNSGRVRHKIVRLALELGFTGIGVYKTHIHLDIKPRESMWTG